MSAPPWRVLIVDDEPLAREGIRVRLAALGGFEVVGECGAGRTAVTAIRGQHPDLVFLDVQMPGMDGFDVVEEIGAEQMPATVFVTAYERYAVRAFDAHALDYVLKPIDDSRFERAVERARQRLADARDGDVGRRLSALLAQMEAERPPRGTSGVDVRAGARRQLVVRDGNRVVVLPADEIDWVEAEGDYVRVHAGERRLLVRATMAAVESMLPAPGHVRIHRSTIVNVARVRELQLQANNEFVVLLRNGAKLKASRGYSERLRTALGIAR